MPIGAGGQQKPHHTIIHKVEKFLPYKKVTLAVFSEIEEVFDKTKTATICKALIPGERSQLVR